MIIQIETKFNIGDFVKYKRKIYKIASIYLAHTKIKLYNKIPIMYSITDMNNTFTLIVYEMQLEIPHKKTIQKYKLENL